MFVTLDGIRTHDLPCGDKSSESLVSFGSAFIPHVFIPHKKTKCSRRFVRVNFRQGNENASSQVHHRRERGLRQQTVMPLSELLWRSPEYTLPIPDRGPAKTKIDQNG